jgi:SAM-dependent methyltransferase
VFSETAEFYDLLYSSFKDYEQETEALAALMEAAAGRPLARLLDTACGTGGHLRHLGGRYEVEGLDLDEGMLAVAARALPGVPLHAGDLLDFELGRRFDAVTCLFSSIAYLATPERLRAATANLSRHLEPGGVLVVEPWISAEDFRPGTLHVHAAEDESRAITRMTTSHLEGRISVLEMHYLLGTSEGIRHAEERHEPALFSDDEYREAFESAGMVSVRRTSEEPFNRGLWIGVAPA